MPTCCNGEEGLVDLIYVLVYDLVDAHNVAVSTDEGQHAKQGAGDETPVYEVAVLKDSLGCDSTGPQDGATDGVGPEELPKGILEG